MNLLESLKEELKTNIKIICLTPYDRDYDFKFLSVQEYIECKDLSDLWTTGFVEEFEYTYQGENSLLNELEEYKFKELLEIFIKEDDIDFLDYEKLTKTVLRWNNNYNDDVDINFHIYNYDVRGSDDEFIYYYNEEQLAQDLFEELTGENIEELNSKYNCLDISIKADCFFNDGNWIDMEYENYQRLKIEFVDNN